MDSDRQIIADAKANGFQDCLAIRNALGWDKPRPDGSYYSSLQVAYRWIEDAGEQVVYLIPDGPTDVPKGNRTGCYPPAFARVLAYKNAVYAERAHEEWLANMATALENREPVRTRRPSTWTGTPTSKVSGPEPSAPDQTVLGAVQERVAARKAAKQASDADQRIVEIQAAANDEERILQAMREYTGPLNKKGYPKGRVHGTARQGQARLWDRR